MTDNNCLPDIIKFNLSRKNYRITSSRNKLIQFIFDSNNETFTLEEFLKVHPNYNVTSYYNNINLLIKENIIGKLNNNNETEYYLIYKSFIIEECLNCQNQKIKRDFDILKDSNVVSFQGQMYVKKCDNCRK